MGSPGAEALAETEAQLEELDLSVLEAIARSADNLLIKAAAMRRRIAYQSVKHLSRSLRLLSFHKPA